MWSIRVQNGVAAFQVFQVLRLATLKKQATEHDKNRCNAGRRTEINATTQYSTDLPEKQTGSQLVNNSPHFNKPEGSWFWSSAAKQIRAALVCDIRTRVVAISYRRFGTTYRAHLQRSTHEDGTYRSSRNAGKKIATTRGVITQKSAVLNPKVH